MIPRPCNQCRPNRQVLPSPTVSSHQMESVRQESAREEAAMSLIPPLTPRRAIRHDSTLMDSDPARVYHGEHQSHPHQPSSSLSAAAQNLPSTSVMAPTMSFEAATFGEGSMFPNGREDKIRWSFEIRKTLQA